MQVPTWYVDDVIMFANPYLALPAYNNQEWPEFRDISPPQLNLQPACTGFTICSFLGAMAHADRGPLPHTAQADKNTAGCASWYSTTLYDKRRNPELQAVHALSPNVRFPHSTSARMLTSSKTPCLPISPLAQHRHDAGNLCRGAGAGLH
jgi:hypothetical protein